MNFSYIINKNFNILPKDSRGLVPITKPKRLLIPTYDGSNEAVHPSVVYVATKWNGYRYWMAMTPYPLSDASKENPSIVASNDGISWEEPLGIVNPIFGPPPTGNYSDPHLEYNFQSNSLEMYYQDNNDGNIYYSNSQNGINWSSPVKTVPSIGTSPSVFKSNFSSNARIFIGPTANGQIRRADSFDGVNFNNFTFLETDFIGTFGHSWFGVDDIGFHGLLSINALNKAWNQSNLYYAYSPNSFDWTIFSSPVLGKGQDGIGLHSIYRSTMCNIGDRWRVYYSERDELNHWHIGYFDCVLAIGETSQYYKKCLIPICIKYDIRDTSMTPFPNTIRSLGDIPDYNKYKNKAIIYTNSHDKPISIRLMSNFRGDLSLTSGTDSLYTYGEVPERNILQLPVGSDSNPTIITQKEWPILATNIPSKVMFYLKADVAPTIGNISIKLFMWN